MNDSCAQEMQKDPAESTFTLSPPPALAHVCDYSHTDPSGAHREEAHCAATADFSIESPSDLQYCCSKSLGGNLTQ